MIANPSQCKEIVRILFKNDKGEPYELYDYQVPIIQGVFFGHPKPQGVCTASTRAGKSEAVGIAIVLVANFKIGEKIRLIAPTTEHTKIVMAYVIQHSLDNEFCSNNLMWDVKGSGAERLRKEVSKQKLTWWNGNELMGITANILGEGRSLVGWGGTTIVVDEAEQIPAEIMRTKVMRMLGDSTESIIFMIGNPVKYGFMYEKQTDPFWHFTKIDCYTCLEQGRFTQSFIDARKAEMLPNEFKIWYEADWPDELDNQLFSRKALEKMFAPLTPQETELLKTTPTLKKLGVDVARFGNDLTVLQSVYTFNDVSFLMTPKSFSKQDTMKTVGEVINKDRIENFKEINIDDPGIGGGVVDRLKEIPEVKQKTFPFVAGEAPFKLKRNLRKDEIESNTRFLNKKSYFYKQFAKMSAEGKIRVVPSSHSQILHNQLKQLMYDFTSNGHLKVIEDETKSPDFADAANVGLYSSPKSGGTFVILSTNNEEDDFKPLNHQTFK